MPRHSVRQELVAAAFERFHALGVNGCGIQEIVDAAGVPKGSFYNHFASKEAMVLEVIDLYASYSRLEMLADQSKPPLERLRAHFEFLAKSYHRNGYTRGCLLGNLSAEVADTSDEIRAAVDGHFTRWSDALTAVLEEAKAAGALPGDARPKLLGRYLLNAWEGALLRMKSIKSRAPLDDFFAITFGTLLA